MGENPIVKRPERGAFLLPGKERRNMAAETSFDYYYGDESNQFSFYRIPRQLVTGDRFKRLSTDAKLLYGLLLDRMSLSAKNGWYDEPVSYTHLTLPTNCT